MKKIIFGLLGGICILFISCQDETLAGDATQAENELSMEDSILVSDGEEDVSFVLNDDSENQIQSKSSYSKTYGHDGSNSGGSNDDCSPDLEGLESSLPENVTVNTTSKPGVDSYFLISINGNSSIAGTDIPAWCADQDLSLENNETNDFAVYSSYEDITTGTFEKPENFDLVNWVLNQSFIGKDSGLGGKYTFAHIQYAIWLLLDDSTCVTCTYLTDENGPWNSDPNNILKAQEIAALALNSTEADGYTPGCGDLMAIVLASATKQSLIITKEVTPKEEVCSDCEGEVTELELEFDWYYSKRVKIYQKNEDSCYGTKIFDQVLNKGEKFTINGSNNDGTFGKYVYIYLNGCYYTKIETDCDTKVGPGYTKGIFNVISGNSSEGGELCEYVKPDYNKCYRHWGCKWYKSCRYKH